MTRVCRCESARRIQWLSTEGLDLDAHLEFLYGLMGVAEHPCLPERAESGKLKLDQAVLKKKYEYAASGLI